MSIIWRPKLFAATGAGFQSDQTLHDGIHLRWMIDPRLGLPFKIKDREWGFFQIYQQHSKFPSLEQAELSIIKSDVTSIPVHSEGDPDNDYRLEIKGQEIYFLRSNQLDANLAAEQLLNQIRSLQSWLLSPEQKEFVEYLKGIAKLVKGETARFQPFFQRGELCALDLAFSKGTGTVPGGDGSTNEGCLGILDAFGEKKYGWVRAYDKEHNLLAEEWIGLFAFKTEYINNPAARNKFSLRFRAAGIHHISIEPVPGQPKMNRALMSWIFCEEYCNAPVWRPVGEPIIRFNANPEDYSASILEDRYYGGFKKTLDWNEAVDLLQNNILVTPELLQLLSSADTYSEYLNAITLNDNNPDTPGSITKGSLPLLPALLHAATDPAVASLLGLYANLADQQITRDIRIVAHMPFFEPDNLAALFQQFKMVTLFNGGAYLMHPHLGFYDVIEKISVQLGGLVLNPFVSPKPLPQDPASVITTVTSVDLPVDPSGTILLVDSVINIPAPPFAIYPYLNVQAYELERKIGDTDFENAAADDQENPLEKLGILPPVYFPTKEQLSSTLSIRDHFTLSLPPEDTVQYKLRAFDVFARPGNWALGHKSEIPVPCYPPSAPSNLSASVNIREEEGWLELFVGLSGKLGDLQAVAQTLEIAVHTLDVNTPGAVENIQWPGILNGRGLQLQYPLASRYPDPGLLGLSCLNLQWSAGQAVWTTAVAGSCDINFPPITPIIEIFDDPNIDETFLEFRTFRIQLALTDLVTLSPGQHRWCVRTRVKGVCPEGDTIFSRESCTGVRYNLVLPPPPVIQPSISIIPESTFPDKKGNSYFTILMNPLLPPVPAGQQSLVSLYRIDLAFLEPDLLSMVEGNILFAGAEERLLRLARANKNPFKKVNLDPVPIRSEPSYYSVIVEGTLENYYVLGVVGTNPEAQESSWDKAAILLFKTPKLLPKPQLRFTGIRSKSSAEKVMADVSFRANFLDNVANPIDTPAVQIVRRDLSGGNSKFVGQASGIWHEEEQYYQFDFSDQSLLPWRHYAYDAILVSRVGEKWVRSELKASGETLAPGMNGIPPITDGLFANIIAAAGGNTVEFEFIVGDFDFTLIKSFPDQTSRRIAGKIRNKTISGLPGASLSLLSGGLSYLLHWPDTEGGEATYTLLLSRGQQMPWSRKIATP